MCYKISKQFSLGFGFRDSFSFTVCQQEVFKPSWLLLFLLSQHFSYSAGFLQVFVDSGNFERISNETLYFIYGSRLCSALSIFRLVFIYYSFLHCAYVYTIRLKNNIHSYYVTKLTNKRFNPLGHCHNS